MAELPTANTLFVMVYCLGGVIGPSVGGFCMDASPRFGLQALLSAGACILFLGLTVEVLRGRPRG
jgi:predicted MFS family arabinose efflux permease